MLDAVVAIGGVTEEEEGAVPRICCDCRAWHQCCCELVELNTILTTFPPELRVTEYALRPLSLATTVRVVGIVKTRISVFSEPSLMKKDIWSVSVAVDRYV